MAHRGVDSDRNVRSRTRGGADQGGGRLAKGDETGGGGVAVLSILGILVFLVVVAILVRTPDNDTQVRTAASPPVTSGASVSQPAPDPAPVVAPVGAVATGGGGTADGGGSLALPVIAGLAALTLLAGSVVVRRVRFQST